MVASTAAGSEENYLNDDCGCLLHTYSLRTWFLSLGFLMAETLLVVDTCPCGVVLFARSNQKCTHQSVEFTKEWDFHRSLISIDVGGSSTNGMIPFGWRKYIIKEVS